MTYSNFVAGGYGIFLKKHLSNLIICKTILIFATLLAYTQGMIVTFGEEYLRQLYEDGKCNDKKHRYQPDIVRRYQKTILFLINASSIEVLWAIRSLNYEVLTGDKAGRSSVRVNDKYRVEFTVSQTSDKPVVTICNVIELSNHYK